MTKAHHWTKNLLIAALTAAWAAGAAAAPNAAVLAQASAEKPAAIDTLRQLVSIESGSRDKEGLDRIAEVLAERLQKLGAEVQLIDPGADAVRMHDTPAALGKVVVGRFLGQGTQKILIIAHMDTVYPHGTLAKRPFRIENSRAYGPGIADDKGGIAVILHTLSILKNINYRDYGTITVAINGDEEISTPGARTLIERLGSEHDYVFSCEPSPAPKDVLALATSGIGAALLTVRGKASHAGVNPQDGRNALMELAHQLSHSGDLSDPARSIKFNWTMANAGTTRNVIPDTASAAADVRVQRVADYDLIEKAFYGRMQQSKLIADTKLEPSLSAAVRHWKSPRRPARWPTRRKPSTANWAKSSTTTKAAPAAAPMPLSPACRARRQLPKASACWAMATTLPMKSMWNSIRLSRGCTCSRA